MIDGVLGEDVLADIGEAAHALGVDIDPWRRLRIGDERAALYRRGSEPMAVTDNDAHRFAGTPVRPYNFADQRDAGTRPARPDSPAAARDRLPFRGRLAVVSSLPAPAQPA